MKYRTESLTVRPSHLTLTESIGSINVIFIILAPMIDTVQTTFQLEWGFGLHSGFSRLTKPIIPVQLIE